MIIGYFIFIFSLLNFYPDAASALTDPRPRYSGIKIETQAAGIYRVSGRDMQNAGVDPASIHPATLRMFRMDKEIPIIVSATGAVLGVSDTIEFYAQGMDNPYTGTDVYWLYWGHETGKSMVWADGGGAQTLPEQTTFKDLRIMEENHVIWGETPGAPEADYWFWEKLTSPQTVEYVFDIYSPVKNAENAVVTVYFQGRSAGSSSATHHTVVTVNDTLVSDEIWTGNTAHAQSGELAQNLLNPGSNRIKIQCKQTGGAPDVVYFNRIEVDYVRSLTAVNNMLRFTLPHTEPVKALVKGFSSQTIRVFDITDPAAPKRILNIQVQADQSKFAVSFAHAGGEKTYLAIDASKILSPNRLVYRKLSDLRRTANKADYVIITSKDFMAALENLAELRRRQNMIVKMADIEDIYDAFSFGFFNPEAIREFLKYAHEKWDLPRPQYVLLAGDANLDYRHYLGAKKQNIVPVYLDKTPDLGLTPSDNWYGCVDGDDRVPELYIGRIPGDSSATVSAIVTKLMRYESTRHQNSTRALFVADDDDPAFEALSDSLVGYLPAAYAIEKVYTRFYPNLDNATKDIQTLVNQGMLLVNFVGHGDVTRWGAEPFGGGHYILEPADLSPMTNKNKLTFVLALDCLNGYFSQPLQYSLAEEWVKAPDKGAMACFAPSGLSHPWEHELLSQFIFSKIFLNSENRLGVITTQAKIDAYYVGVSDHILISFNLIGDPATRLAIGRHASDLVKVHAITASAGSGGAVSPPGETLVFDKGHQTYSILPGSGYEISEVTVDGASVGKVSSYTFENVLADHTIRATFKKQGGGGGGCFFIGAAGS